MNPKHVAVIDIGKTNAKLALVDARDLSEITVISRPNLVREGPPYPHFDVEVIWDFLLEGLAEFHKRHGIDAISVTTHGASGALIAEDGGLAAPILDYEFDGPESIAADYDALRPAFEETGSPRLPAGQNLGAQIHWQFVQDPALFDRTKYIVTYPQYWGHRLTGVAACDLSSLGSHSDLWNPFKADISTLVNRLGIGDMLAPARRSSDVLGPVLPEIATKTGLRPDTPVFCGIHDSNASLLPHVLRRDPPFSVVSTGTWVIVMTVGAPKVTLDPSRDTLMNVNGLGAPVPSARFMGGREFETIRAGHDATYTPDTMIAVAEHGPLLMPAVVPECGPFQGCECHWVGQEPKPGTPERIVALSFYLALMTAECLSLTGHQGPIVVEGPFGANAGYCNMLSVATDCTVMISDSATGTSQGAALLGLNTETLPNASEPTAFETTNTDIFRAYAERWRRAVHS